MYTQKLLFALCLSASSFFAHSQVLENAQTSNSYLQRGALLIGGNLSYLNVTQNYNSGSFGGTNSYTSGIFIGSVSLASMVTNQIAVGGKITYLNSSNYVLGSNGSNAVIGPTARLYFNNERPSKVFLLGDVGFNTSGGGAAYDVGLGLANFVSNYVSIDITGTYGNSFSINGIQTQPNSVLNVSAFALQVGLQIYLPKKKI